jgi:hypothetical protein
VSGDVHKSRDSYYGHVLWIKHFMSVPVCLEMQKIFTPDMDLKGIILGVFQCVWRCAQVQRFYSRHGLQRKQSRSVPVCSEMCRNPECFSPDMYSKELLRVKVSGLVHIFRHTGTLLE